MSGATAAAHTKRPVRAKAGLKVQQFSEPSGGGRKSAREKKRGFLNALLMLSLVFVKLRLCLFPKSGGRLSGEDGRRKNVKELQQFPV